MMGAPWLDGTVTLTCTGEGWMMRGSRSADRTLSRRSSRSA